MPFRNFPPEATFFALIVAVILKLIPRSKKRSIDKNIDKKVADEPSEPEKANISAMKKVVDEHEDFTAEVIDICVFGRKRVETFRLLSPGREVELRNIRGDIKVFAYGEYIAELIVPENSNLPRLFDEHVHFEAYIGGRDLAFMYDNTCDFCSIIVFYKLEGIPPTKVNLK